MILGPGYVLTCESFTRTYPRDPFSFCHKMVALEARPSPLRIEGTSDIPARSSSSVLRIPFPIPSNMVPSHRRPGSYVSTRCLFGIRCISRHVTLSFTDWFFFLVLDIGNSAIEEIPLNVRVLLGFMQATAVRTAGFAAVPLAALAPGVL